MDKKSLVKYVGPLVITITRQCNLACPFCLSNSGPGIHGNGEMTLDQWVQAVDQFETIGVARITGGEALNPTTYDKTVGLLKHLNKRGVPVQINTNGTSNFDLELDNELDKSLVTFQVSIDGKPKEHDKFRGDGVFVKAIAFIKQMKQRGYKVHTMSVVFNENLSDMEYVHKLTHQVGVESRYQVGASVGRAKTFELATKEFDKMAELEKKVLDITDNCRHPFIGTCPSHISAGGTYLSVDEKGYIVPCPYLQNHKFAHILNWNEEEVVADMKRRISDKQITCYFPTGLEFTE